MRSGRTSSYRRERSLMAKASESERECSPYDSGLNACAANYAALSPLSFLPKAAVRHPDRTALIYGEVRRSWRETFERCQRLAAALQQLGVRRGDTVAIMAPNIPAMY